MVETWNKLETGVLQEDTLLLKACKAGAYGNSFLYNGGGVYHAYFVYLCGNPNRTLFEEKPDLFYDKSLVCMSSDWEDFIRKQTTLDSILLRRLMVPLCKFSPKKLPMLPSGYRLTAFDADAFSIHPFRHGLFYDGYDDFSKRGSGAVVWYGNRIVASASSHLTLGNDVELDVTTDAEHRRKGLADHCVAAMLNNCAARGLTVHWDAKNTPSMNMALTHGFRLQQEYAVYILKHG